MVIFVEDNYSQLTVLLDEKEIKEAQEKLFHILTSRVDKIVHGRAGFPGGSVSSKIYWISDLHFWYMNETVDKDKSWYDPRLGGERYWNAFGMNEPKEDEGNVILCEINSPLKGINRRVGGAFAKDPMGNYYLIHRGNLGGNYSKKFFMENYRGEWTKVIDGDRKTDVVVIGPLDDTLPEKIKNFLYEIKRMKSGKLVLRIIADEEEINRAQKKLFNILKDRATEMVDPSSINFTWPGAKEAYWISDLGMWYSNRFREGHHKNDFGTNEPGSSEKPIICEINIPVGGVDRRVGGAFAKDPHGDYYLVHRGNIRGLRLTKEVYNGEWITVMDDDRESEVIFIGRLDNSLPEKIRDFVYEIQKIKNSIFKYMIKGVLDDYLSAKEESFKGHPLANLIRDRLPREISRILGEDYIIEGFAGQINWARIPWVAIMDPRVTKTVRDGYYIAYLFKENMEGVYLALMQGVENVKEKYGRNASEILRDRASKLRAQVQCENCLENISLTEDDQGHPCEDGIIYATYYPGDDLPDDDQLVSDLKKFLKIYKKLNFLGSFYEFLESRGFYFDSEVVENFLLSLKVKPFVILTGNSGTGKTKLAQLYGEYISNGDKRYLMVPVGANWTEKRHIFGYLNIMSGEYQSTPALDFIMKAAEDPDNPYLLILDEMNLSHVERYFSDFLSAIESGEPIPLHDDPDCDFPRKIRIPRNLIVVGTVNVDETTYMFSPKVLDRANTIESKTINPTDYLTNKPRQKPQGNMEFLEDPLNHKTEVDKIKDELPIMNQLISELEFFYKELKDPGFDFGFRVVHEILSFMHAAWIYEGKPQVG